MICIVWNKALNAISRVSEECVLNELFLDLENRKITWLWSCCSFWRGVIWTFGKKTKNSICTLIRYEQDSIILLKFSNCRLNYTFRILLALCYWVPKGVTTLEKIFLRKSSCCWWFTIYKTFLRNIFPLAAFFMGSN